MLLCGLYPLPIISSANLSVPLRDKNGSKLVASTTQIQNMKYTFILFAIAILSSCSAQHETEQSINLPQADSTALEAKHGIDTLFAYYQKQTEPSKSIGSVSDGRLEHGRIVPFSGDNFCYFDTLIYASKRAFVNQKVLSAMLASYKVLDSVCPNRNFGIMECSNEHGGQIKPHRTHQNGLSVDFMTPLLKSGEPTDELSDLGAQHYLMEFDATGKYLGNKAYSIDFNTVALHLLTLADAAEKNGLKIDKVIWKIELKDELFATENGKKLKAKGIYFAAKLSPLINSLHDDHYHVDFKLK